LRNLVRVSLSKLQNLGRASLPCLHCREVPMSPCKPGAQDPIIHTPVVYRLLPFLVPHQSTDTQSNKLSLPPAFLSSSDFYAISLSRLPIPLTFFSCPFLKFFSNINIPSGGALIRSIEFRLLRGTTDDPFFYLFFFSQSSPSFALKFRGLSSPWISPSS